MRALAAITALVVLASLAPGQARADSTPYFHIGPQLSSLGAGAEAGLRINDYLGVRIGGNYFAAEFSDSIDDIDYELDFRLASAGAVLDVHPFGGGLRLSGGVRWNGNNVDLTARPNGSITVGGVPFSAAEAGAVKGDLELNSVAPYVGLGYQGSYFKNRLLLALEVGVLFQGRPNVELIGTGTLANDPTFRAAVEREEEDVEDKLKILRFYPVIALTLTYRF